jgi:Ca2+-transporting ATPase
MTSDDTTRADSGGVPAGAASPAPGREWHRLTADEALGLLEVDPQTGLEPREAEERLRRFGPNSVGEAKPTHPAMLLLAQFKDFIIYVLLAAALIAGVLLREYVDLAVILAIVAANAVLGFAQEYRAEKALHALKRLSAPTVRVRRGGRVEVLAAEALVPGDVILVEEGDHIAADARILSCSSLRVNEASLTGEAEAAGKSSAPLDREGLGPGDKSNMLFQGTFVERGRGEAVVVETGRRTHMGGIAQLLEEAEEAETPIQAELQVTGKRIALLCLAICAMIFVEGLIEGQEWKSLFLFSVSLAVAAIPEGLPAVVTVALSLGVRRLAAEKSIVRRLAAVETLGATSVICTDKTGTLTRSEMAARRLWLPEEGTLDLEVQEEAEEAAAGIAGVVPAVAALCNDAWSQDGEYVGEGTEVALLKMAEALGYERDSLTRAFPRVGEIPFESERKMMSTLHGVEDPDMAEELFGYGRPSRLLLSKGAPEVIVARCSGVIMPGGPARLEEGVAGMILAEAERMAAEGLRTMAFAYRALDWSPADLEGPGLEEEEVFAGLVGMMDPPRPEVFDALQECRSAHVRVVMITGDHVVTARAVAQELGILEPGGEIMPGSELARLEEEELAERVERVAVYARVSPADKVKIVRAWKSKGAVVAMTGDGVNDAPALKHADIGVAMGITGTDVSKEAADMVLADDNFATIVRAVREGRVIFDNLKKFIYFLLSCNISEVVTMFVGMLVEGQAPLVAVQVLWINLVTDGFPAMALGVDSPVPGIMQRPPRDPAERVLSWNKIRMLLWQGLALSGGGLAAFFLARYWLYPGDQGVRAVQTMVFCTLVFAQLLHALNCRSEELSFFRLRIWDKPVLPVALLASLALQLLVVTVPPLMRAFKTESLSLTAWLVTAACAVFPALLIDRVKALKGRMRKIG